jgi:hypothetical protein
VCVLCLCSKQEQAAHCAACSPLLRSFRSLLHGRLAGRIFRAGSGSMYSKQGTVAQTPSWAVCASSHMPFRSLVRAQSFVSLTEQAYLVMLVLRFLCIGREKARHVCLLQRLGNRATAHQMVEQVVACYHAYAACQTYYKAVICVAHYQYCVVVSDRVCFRVRCLEKVPCMLVLQFCMAFLMFERACVLCLC